MWSSAEKVWRRLLLTFCWKCNVKKNSVSYAKHPSKAGEEIRAIELTVAAFRIDVAVLAVVVPGGHAQQGRIAKQGVQIGEVGEKIRRKFQVVLDDDQSVRGGEFAESLRHWLYNNKLLQARRIYVKAVGNTASYFVWPPQWFSNGGTRIPWRTQRCSKGYTNFFP